MTSTSLITGASSGLPPTFETNDIEDEVRHLRLHDEVPMRLMHAVLPGMLARSAAGGHRVAAGRRAGHGGVVPSRRYRAIYAVARVAPSRLVAKLAERGR